MSKLYIRTCQSCGHQQPSKAPKTYKTPNEAWRDLLCKKCKSPDLDYGTYKIFDNQGHEILPSDDY